MRSCSSSSNAPSEEEDPSSCSPSSPDSITILVEGDPIDSSVLDKLSPCTRREERRVTPVCTTCSNSHSHKLCSFSHRPIHVVSKNIIMGPNSKPKSAAVGPNFTSDITWKPLILLSLSKKRPRNMFNNKVISRPLKFAFRGVCTTALGILLATFFETPCISDPLCIVLYAFLVAGCLRDQRLPCLRLPLLHWATGKEVQPQCR